MRRILIWALALAVTAGVSTSALAQCKNLAKAAKDVPFTKEVKADANAVYLTLIGGDSPKPNACGLKPKNSAAEWMGWGGPLDTDNASIGEGVGTRNFITIGGTRFARGIGTHGLAKFVFDLTGGAYAKFAGFVGMDDEKDGPAGFANPDCGHGGTSEFIFSVDGKEMAKSGVLKGVDAGKQVDAKLIEFAIPAGAKELTISVADGGDGIGCDHADIGDPKLILAGGPTSVEPAGKAATTWAAVKAGR
jgi:hypothetical protein